MRSFTFKKQVSDQSLTHQKSRLWSESFVQLFSKTFWSRVRTLRAAAVLGVLHDLWLVVEIRPVLEQNRDLVYSFIVYSTVCIPWPLHSWVVELRPVLEQGLDLVYSWPQCIPWFLAGGEAKISSGGGPWSCVQLYSTNCMTFSWWWWWESWVPC